MPRNDEIHSLVDLQLQSSSNEKASLEMEIEKANYLEYYGLLAVRWAVYI